MKQGQDGISGYYTKMKMIWDQLDAVDPIPMCACTNCNCICNIRGKLVKSQEDRRLVEFQMKFNDGFEVIRGSILIMNPLPAISHAYKLLLQEKNHKKLYQPSSNTDDIMAFAVNNNRRHFQDK